VVANLIRNAFAYTESGTVSIRVDAQEALWMLDAHMKPTVEAGTFDILIGSSSTDIRLQKPLTVK
jgi:hypothetical protein